MKKAPVLSILLLAIIGGTAFSPGPDKPTRESLGKLLFFDPILSEDSSISCASCHKPEFAFADTAMFSTGVHGRKATRNTPSAMNMSSREVFFWDGRAATLEEQALGPIENPLEMNMPVDLAIKRLNDNPRYREMFHSVFKQLPNRDNLAQAIAAFERTLETFNTPNDRWLNDEANGMTEQQIRGRNVFRTKGKCLECHFSPDFTADEFRAIGLFDGKTMNDSGRYLVTKNPGDLGKMKVPGLRNVAVTAPYMHNGHFKTLRAVIDYYDNPALGMPDGLNRDSLLLQPLGLTEPEKQDLEAFLHALTDDQFVKQ